MKPLLICELGLHGDGDLAYHTRIVDELVREWSGWPPLAIKVQLWSPTGAWAEGIRKEHGREPLACLSPANLRTLKAYCIDRTLLFGCTAHDPESVRVLEEVKPDFVKLGARADRETIDAAVDLGLPLVSSSSNTNQGRQMECVSAYPANMPWTGLGGYSCHAVPSLAREFVLKAAPSCATIEVHVTTRPRGIRPLPADMCVSMSVPQFLELAERVGEIWKA